MKLAIFAKKRQAIDPNTGKSRDFWTYLTTLISRSSGEPLTVQVKFREACGAPDPAICPCFIEVPKGKANLSWDSYENEDGEKLQAAKMWVTEWENAGAYEDHTLDDYDAFTGV
jgi:hypothetical protein